MTVYRYRRDAAVEADGVTWLPVESPQGDGWVDKTHLTIEIQKNHVRIAGERATADAERASVHRRERAGGSFDRTVTFPVALDSSQASARYEDGILTVTLPPAAELTPRTITVG